MRNQFILGIAAISLATAGCATKGYVAKQNAPLQQQIDELSTKTGKHEEEINKANEEIARNRTDIGVTKEVATAAGTRANEAGTKADAANATSAKNTNDIEALRQVVANIDDYSIAEELHVLFGFDRDTLSKEAQAQLDEFAAQKPQNGARYFLAIEGYTDRIGNPDYNFALSKRRADHVVQYLVAKHQFPIYRIYTVGLGAERPTEEAKDAASRAKNRRVEVRLYTVPAAQASAAAGPASAKN